MDENGTSVQLLHYRSLQYTHPTQRMHQQVLQWAAQQGVERDSVQGILLDVASSAVAGPLRLVQAIWTSIHRPEPESAPETTLQVAVVGYGRTGTYSMTLALNQLGIKTLHPNEWASYTAVLDHWHETIVLASIQQGRFELGRPDFQHILSTGNFQGLADMPTCLYVDQLVQQFPDALFILTTRSSLEVWLESFLKVQEMTTFMHYLGTILPVARQFSDYYRWLFAHLVGDDALLQTPWPPRTQIIGRAARNRAVQRYQQHNEWVRSIVPAERLLEYQVTEGWKPLCEFLKVTDCPTDTPFPRSNTTLSYAVQAASAVLFMLGLLILPVLILNRCRRRSKRSNKMKQL